MSDAIEAAGGGMTVALAAHAIDPDERAPAAGANTCRNCGAATTGRYCAQCGQAVHLHRSVGHVVEEFLHGVLHFDSKAWRTLPVLALHPGRLTRNYVQGQRARYVAPLALFLLSIFVVFFVFGFSEQDGLVTPGATVAATEQSLRDMEAEIAEARRTGSPELPRLLAFRDTLAKWRDRLAKDSAAGPAVVVADIVGTDAEAPGDPADMGRLERAGRQAAANPALFLDRMKNKAYKLSFLLVPMSLPWMWLAFVRRRDVRMYDHVVFLLYGLSFMALMLVLVRVAEMLGAGGIALMLVAPLFLVHLFRHLRGAYALSVRGAAWRTGFLTVGAGVTLVLYSLLIVALGLLD